MCKKNMKELCFLTNNINQLGGIERVISLLSEGFSKINEADLTILSLYSKPGSDCYFRISEKTHCIHANLTLGQPVNDYLIRFFKENRFDDLVTFHPGIAFIVSQIVNRIKPIRWIATEHCHPASYSWKRRLLNLVAYRKADCMVVLTDEIADYYKRKRIRNVIVIPNPVSFVVNEPNQYLHNVLAVGRVEEIKRFDFLVKAFGSIEKKYPNWVLRIAGGGTRFDDLKQKAEPFNNIELLGPRKDIKELMMNSSFLVITSQFEAFPLVALEAMECGLPLVSTELPSIHFITKGYNAVLFVNQNDCDDLSKKMEQLMSDSCLIKYMGAEAKKCAKQYHLDTIMKYWTAIL